MSLDDSTAPETAGSPDGTGGRPAKTFVLGGLALALVVGLIGFFAVRGASGEPEATANQALANRGRAAPPAQVSTSLRRCKDGAST